MMPESLGFEYSLIRSDRRTLSVKITRDARVEVRAPKRMGVREIEKFLFEKRLWIQKHLSQTEANQQSAAAFLPDENSKLLLLGREYPLAKTEGNIRLRKQTAKAAALTVRGSFSRHQFRGRRSSPPSERYTAR